MFSQGEALLEKTASEFSVADFFEAGAATLFSEPQAPPPTDYQAEHFYAA